MSEEDKPATLTPETGWRMTLSAIVGAVMAMMAAGAWLANKQRDINDAREKTLEIEAKLVKLEARLDGRIDGQVSRMDALSAQGQALAGINSDQNRDIQELQRRADGDDRRWQDFANGDWRQVWTAYIRSQRDAAQWQSPRAPR